MFVTPGGPDGLCFGLFKCSVIMGTDDGGSKLRLGENRSCLEKFRLLSNTCLEGKMNYFVALSSAGFLEGCLGNFREMLTYYRG